MDRMFDAIGMSRERDLYITNILFWRPPGNRTPTLAEQAICLAFTRRHIELARPKVLVLAGGTAAKAVLDTTEGIMRMRGKWTSVRLDDGSEGTDAADLPPRLPAAHTGKQAPELAGPFGARQEAEGAGRALERTAVATKNPAQPERRKEKIDGVEHDHLPQTAVIPSAARDLSGPSKGPSLRSG